MSGIVLMPLNATTHQVQSKIAVMNTWQTEFSNQLKLINQLQAEQNELIQQRNERLVNVGKAALNEVKAVLNEAGTVVSVGIKENAVQLSRLGDEKIIFSYTVTFGIVNGAIVIVWSANGLYPLDGVMGDHGEFSPTCTKEAVAAHCAAQYYEWARTCFGQVLGK